MNLRTKNFISLYNFNCLVYITDLSPSEAQWTIYVATDYLLILLRSVHLVYLSVLCESENKEKLFPYTTLTYWYLVTEISPSEPNWTLSLPPNYLQYYYVLSV